MKFLRLPSDASHDRRGAAREICVQYIIKSGVWTVTPYYTTISAESDNKGSGIMDQLSAVWNYDMNQACMRDNSTENSFRQTIPTRRPARALSAGCLPGGTVIYEWGRER